MNAIPGNITQLAFGKKDDAPLTRSEEEICEEFTSGKASDLMKVDIEDPNMLAYAGLYNKLQHKQDAIWESIEATHSIAVTQPLTVTPVLNLQPKGIGTRTWLLAAAVLSGSIIGVYTLYNFLNSNKQPQTATTSIEVVKPIEPGKERATLTLANNTQIDLETIPAGVIAQQDQMEISKQGNNEIVYTISPNNTAGGNSSNNSLATPYGGEYKVTLADGSKVWLNAGSTLSYPTAFNGAERRVEMTGEGYFEVAENKTKPFRVFARGTEVKVFGTKFNVKAYNTDNQVTTTLVKGSIAVQHGTTLKPIKPNQQAIVTGDDILIKNKSKEEVVRVLAWKNGLINLEGESVQSILEQIKRWYNVETKIEPGTPETTLTGTIEKTTPLASVLQLLNTNLSVTFTLTEKDRLVVAEKK